MTVFQVRNPRTGQHDYQFEAASTAQIEQTAASHRDAAKAWHKIGLGGRITKLKAFADALGKHRASIAVSYTHLLCG